MLRASQHGEVARYRMARTVAGQPLFVGSCYRIGDVLVDTGPPNNGRELRRALRGHRVRTILLTHGHEDHYGNAALFPQAEALGAPGMRLFTGVPFYRRVTWGEPRPAQVGPVPPRVDAGGRRLVPVPTPGHTPDHLAYWEPDQRWLFAGDAALGLLKYGFRGEAIHAYIASLRAMRDLGPEVVFPAHGAVLEQPREQLGAQLAHLERLRDAARELAARGMSTGAVAHRLLGREGLMGRLSRGEFGKARLIEELLGRA